MDIIEKLDKEPAVETVRGAIFHRGKFLLIEKDASSENPGALEFPGGNIDEIAGKTSNLEEQQIALISEVQQEARIDIRNIHTKKIGDFLVYFETGGKGNRHKYRRRVHLFLVKIPDTENIEPQVNRTMNESGKPEDKHASWKLVSPEELLQLASSLRQNPITQESVRLLAKNSRHIKSLLDAIKT